VELLQFDTKLISNSEIKIPDNLKTKIELNKEVKIFVIPTGEKLYDDWEDDEWNRLSTILNDQDESE
jgi:hypothetical protein